MARSKCIYFVSYKVIMIFNEILTCIRKFSTTPWGKVPKVGPPSNTGFHPAPSPDRHRSLIRCNQVVRAVGMRHTIAPVALHSPGGAPGAIRTGSNPVLEGGGPPNRDMHSRQPRMPALQQTKWLGPGVRGMPISHINYSGGERMIFITVPCANVSEEPEIHA